MPSYIATYIVKGDEITVSTDGTQILSSLIGQTAYLGITKTSGPEYLINLAEYMLFEKNINYTMTLLQLTASLTDLNIQAYTSQDIPMIDRNNGSFDYRLNVYDAYITSDVNVSWTSIETPTIRDDIYQRDYLNDLVISSTTRDFSNCLVSVNGVFHPTYFFNKELYVESGFSNIKNSRQNKIAIYDTTSLGGHVIVPIGSTNIDASNNNPFSGVTLTFPNMDFTGTTVLLVLGGYLYALDDTYRLINTNRLMIDICKMDLIDQIIHDPNTSYVFDNTEIVAADTSGPPALTVVDEITYYLESVYPGAIANVVSPVNFINFTGPTVVALTAPPTTELMIEYFLKRYPYTIPAGTNSLLEEFDNFLAPNRIVGSIPITDFTDPRLVYSLLLQPNSFIIAIKNDKIYKKTYGLYRTEHPSQYVAYSQDTPRGILQYDKNRSIPYLLYKESNNLNYNFTIDYSKLYKDVYKTNLNPSYIPSPTLDVKTDRSFPIRLLELYSPS